VSTEQERKLVEKWRKNAAVLAGGITATEMNPEREETLTECADELEALLTQPAEPQQVKEALPEDVAGALKIVHAMLDIPGALHNPFRKAIETVCNALERRVASAYEIVEKEFHYLIGTVPLEIVQVALHNRLKEIRAVKGTMLAAPRTEDPK
jgi:hypothetical protein